MNRKENSHYIFSLLKKKYFWIAVLFLFLSIYGVTSVRKQLNSGNDFPIYYYAAKTMLSGESPYDVSSGLHGYVYLPFFAILLSPLAFVPLWVAVVTWYIINVILIIISVWLTVKILSIALPHKKNYWSIVISLLITTQFFLYNLDLGQSNLLTLCLTILAIHLLLKGKSEFLTGVPIGISSVIKPYSLLMLIPLLFRGRWKICLGSLASIIICTVILPIIVVGSNQSKVMMDDWYNKIIVPQQRGILQGSKIWDQSPQAALRRLTVDTPAFGDRKINIVSLSPGQFQTINQILQICLFITFLIVWLIGAKKTTRLTLLADLALSYCGMVLLFGFNLKAHFVVLLIPWSMLVSIWRIYHSSNVPLRSAIKWLIYLSGIITIISNPGIIGRTASNWALAYSSITIGTLFVMSAIIIIRLRWIPNILGYRS